VSLGGIDVQLGAPGRGITSWTLRHAVVAEDLDGLATTTTAARSTSSPSASNPNGAIGIDQIVITTPRFDRTAEALRAAGMPLRRIQDGGSFRQGFRRLGPAILELVEVPAGPPGPARFWGLVVIVGDLQLLSRRIRPHVGEIRDAVQPGRHIATLGESAGLSTKVAFMDAEA
jgi:hypothetical protein